MNAWTEHCRVLNTLRYDVIRYNAITELNDNDEKKQMGQTENLYSGREFPECIVRSDTISTVGRAKLIDPSPDSCKALNLLSSL